MGSTLTTEQVWTRMRADLLAFFRRRVRDEHRAEDLLQETFVRVHDGLAGLAQEERLVPWVYRIARNVLADHRRRERSRGSDDARLEPGSEDAPSIAERGEENLNEEVSRWLEPMLAGLPPEQREAVQLAEIAGVAQTEIARRLGLSPSGAKSRVQRGRARLRDLLLECCHLDFDRCGNVVGYARRAGGGDCCPKDGCSSGG